MNSLSGDRRHLAKERAQCLAEYDLIKCSRGKLIAGVDEVGRGAIAGPIVAASVLIPAGLKIEGVYDSKKIPKIKHEELSYLIRQNAFDYSFALLSNDKIDMYGIQEANYTVLQKSVLSLRIRPAVIMSDWLPVDIKGIKNYSEKKGDTVSMAIACASILAKHFRDRIMNAYSKIEEFDAYQFSRNAGYGTKLHYEIINRVGISSIHRKTFLKGLII